MKIYFVIITNMGINTVISDSSNTLHDKSQETKSQLTENAEKISRMEKLKESIINKQGMSLENKKLIGERIDVLIKNGEEEKIKEIYHKLHIINGKMTLI